ncbi:hypothetical protein Lxx20530 [Leifsonia xyli subsp. xyli str. CTCB07]|uniref:Uncharacterized protein n=1 Tax=Leifsonia xyli subsp. xyli (strain CTCB07) TaxID=281090 RepID=Q6ACY1_LEIXX|nr:hypothetical protein Lxx20530 [Leifsonia xyli subsp. xyli str. CTCB07]
MLSPASGKLTTMLPARTDNQVSQWSFSQPGVYCVPVTWTATKAGSRTPVSVRKVLTFAAGVADDTGITSCSRGQKPTGQGSGR